MSNHPSRNSSGGASAHTGFTRLPIVDISGLHSPHRAEREACASSLGEAAQEAGFLYVSGHRVPVDLTERLIARARQYFALPLEQKMKSYIGLSANHRGYVPEGEEVFAGGTRDRKEAFDLGMELPPESPAVDGRPMLGPNVWPDLPGFREDVSAYYRAVFELGRVLFRGFALWLGLPEDALVRLVNEPPSQLRLIHYPYDPDAVDSIGIGAHTDYECFTTLLPTAPGLEVMNGSGQWIEAPPIPGTFVVNIGDSLETLTNGVFVATSHRVRKVSEERYSFPFFNSCDYDTLLAPLPEFITPDRPARYQALIAGAHLYAQTAQTFQYLKKRVDSGELLLPETLLPLSSFGQQTRKLTESPAPSSTQ